MKELKLTAVILLFVVVASPVWAQWTEPVSVDEINTGGYESGPSLSHDGLSLYFG